MRVFLKVVQLVCPFVCEHSLYALNENEDVIGLLPSESNNLMSKYLAQEIGNTAVCENGLRGFFGYCS